jgi:hypothetical protein
MAVGFQYPVAGPEAMRWFWEGRNAAGIRDHTFEIVATGSDEMSPGDPSRSTTLPSAATIGSGVGRPAPGPAFRMT